MLLQILPQEVVDILHTARMLCLFVFKNMKARKFKSSVLFCCFVFPSSHYSFPLAEVCLTAIFRKSPINF